MPKRFSDCIYLIREWAKTLKGWVGGRFPFGVIMVVALIVLFFCFTTVTALENSNRLVDARHHSQACECADKTSFIQLKVNTSRAGIPVNQQLLEVARLMGV